MRTSNVFPTGTARPGRMVVAILAGALLALAAPAAEAAKRKRAVKVMTRNVYLGADLTPALEAGNLQELFQRASEIMDEVERTDFRQRAKPLAREIAEARPHLVGLQEVAKWRRDADPPTLDGPATPAREVTFDFLGILRRKLRRQGEPYRIAQSQREADLEVPTADGFDGRLTMRDVILYRKRKGRKRRIRLRNGRMDNFETNLRLSVAGVPVTVRRGWTALDANVGRGWFRFVNTHLEAFDPDVRLAQARELTARGGPLRPRLPMILVGDINSDDDLPDPADELAFRHLLDFGLVERQTRRHSCCYSSGLNDPTERFDHTVDHVMTKPRLRLRRSFVTGDDPDERTRSGLWPSDHGGVFSRLRLPRR